ncbi:MAG: hypothetical protein PHI63_04800 [Patescibacteria group bacterium]|nr:hypothetical protein [Patescibacteria group bacterium]
MKKLLAILSILTLAACTRQVEFGAGEKPAAHTPQELAQDAAINPYTDKGDRLEKVMAQSLPQSGEAKIELLKSEPKAILSKWDGEVQMGVKYTGLQATGDREFLTDKVAYKDAKQEVHAYPIAPKAGMEDGGLEIEVILKEKPDTNKFCFQIDGAEDLVFTKQLPLWQEAGLSAPTKDCTDTDCVFPDGDSAHRPENVVNSYVVSHATKRNYRIGGLNYGTGKFQHIYRIQVIDADGLKEWGDLEYADGKLCAIVPQKFLDTATYPVMVDPTYGYTSNAATGTSNAENTLRIYGGWGNSSQAGNAKKVTFYGNAVGSAANARGVIYLDSDLSSVTWGAQVSVSTSLGWKELSVTTTTVSTVAYRPGIWMGTEGTGWNVQYDAAAAGYVGYRDNTAYHATNDPPTPYTVASSNASRQYGIYFTYTCPDTGTCTFNQGQTEDWTAPVGITSVTVECWGAGGCGGGNAINATGGGGGGAYAQSVVSVTPGTNYTITIGTCTTVGGNGTNSTFGGSTVVAEGGDGGGPDWGGEGGAATSSTGTITNSGGKGASDDAGHNQGGGGGGAGGPDGAGQDGTAGNATVGGAGGGGDAGSGGAGGAGGDGGVGGNGVCHVKGGGGGGGGDNTFRGGSGACGGGGGGNGGDVGSVTYITIGQCILTYSVPAPAGYCGHTGGDWFINSACWISANTTTNGTLYIGAGGSINCTNNAIIQVQGIQGTRGLRGYMNHGCKFQGWDFK